MLLEANLSALGKALGYSMNISTVIVSPSQVRELKSGAVAARLRRPPLPALTSIRFVFSMMVLVGHFQVHYADELPAPPSWIGGIAPNAVAFFFVLSGFILAYNYPTLPTTGAALKFLVLRIARIYPVHITTILAGVLLFVESQARIIYFQPLDYIFNASLTQTWTLIPFTSMAFNGPAWSISDEWFFYLMFPAVIARNRWISWSAVVLPIAFSLWLKSEYGCLMSPAVVGTYDPFAISCATIYPLFPPSRFIEFLMGVILCRLMWPNDQRKTGLLQLACVTVAIATLQYNPNVPSVVNGLVSILITPAIGCLIIGGLSLQRGALTTILSNKPSLFLGEISFSVYMTHMIVFSWFWAHPALISSWHVGLKFAFLVGIILLVSSLLFIFVESPARNAAKGWTQKYSAARATTMTVLVWIFSATVVWAIGYIYFLSFHG
jgi:peptidoglycan/LPS O-acetylase OafA/YrhL